ncbi:MAG TPA: site-2 protease family protein [Verrucomicrobiae bacterium]|nr:site-2 protease family protein [Verrucomicrobiae bacterium]
MQCWQNRRDKRFKYLLGYWLASALVAVGFLFFPSTKGVGYLFLNLLLLDLSLLLTVLPHEFGHALAGKLVGFRVFAVIAGSGRIFYKRRLLGFDMELKFVPFGVVTILTPKSDRNFKLNYAFCIFAGPLVNLLVVLIMFLAMPRPIWSHGDFGQFHGNPFLIFLGQKLMPLQMILAANIWVLASNLWPRHINSSIAGRIPNDGLSLLKIAFMKPERINRLLTMTYVYEASEAFQEKRYKEARKWCEEGLAKYPENQLLVNQLGITFLQQELFQEARRLFYKQVQLNMSDPVQNALALNNLAYTDIMLGNKELLSEADACSRQAVEKLPWMAAIKGTRGNVLIELGQIEQGIVLLRESMRDGESASSKAENACHIASAEQKRGNMEEFQRYLEMARSLDPDCLLLKRFPAE